MDFPDPGDGEVRIGTYFRLKAAGPRIFFLKGSVTGKGVKNVILRNLTVSLPPCGTDYDSSKTGAGATLKWSGTTGRLLAIHSLVSRDPGPTRLALDPSETTGALIFRASQGGKVFASGAFIPSPR